MYEFFSRFVVRGIPRSTCSPLTPLAAPAIADVGNTDEGSSRPQSVQVYSWLIYQYRVTGTVCKNVYAILGSCERKNHLGGDHTRVHCCVAPPSTLPYARFSDEPLWLLCQSQRSPFGRFARKKHPLPFLLVCSCH